MEFARIKLAGRDHKELEDICSQIKDIAKKLGTSVRGPMPLPTRRLKIPVLKTPCGDGTGHGNATWDRWEMRIHRRVIDVGSNERVMRQITRISFPEDIKINIEMRTDNRPE
ncbi:MAG: 30S ribosomal protein S10 [Candidatus Aenigmarchaeota archaeon]|nr:30S ribosomal protein S10 [Candidatus Aenigmarchaeota archaeon]